MADPLTSTLRLTEPTIGGDTGLWAGYLNNNMIFTDEGINQTISVSIPDTNVTLVADGTTGDQARYYGYNFTGALTANRTVTLPNVQRQGWAANNTTGGFNVILTSGAGTNVTLAPDGIQRLYATDGSTNSSLPSVGFGNVWQKIAQVSVSGAGTQALSMPTAFQRFRITMQGVVVNTNSAVLILQTSSDGGSTYYSSTQYQYASWYSDYTNGSTSVGGANVAFFAFTGGLTASSAQPSDAHIDIWPGTGSLRPVFRASSYGFGSDSLFRQGVSGGGLSVAAVMNFVRVGASTGTFSGTVILEALP